MREALADPIMDMIKDGARIVDVRTEEEFEDEHYPNALNLPLDRLEHSLSALGPKDAPLVLYCASGSRSAYAARLLTKAGFTRVVNAGGLYDMP